MTLGDFNDTERVALSALADGELDAAGLAVSCAAWSRDAALRADWHAWHLIGDVLRSEDLASDPRGDRRFCAAIETRLRSEPVVLAPTRAAPPISAALRRGPPARRSRWAAGVAVAAGVVMVAGAFAILRPGDTPGPTRLATADGPAGATASSGARIAMKETAASELAIVADNKVVRDARLDRYLEAHKQFAGTSALGVPSAFLRGATIDSAAR